MFTYAFLWYIHHKIRLQEEQLAKLFLARTDILPAMYEISKNYIIRHKEIFFDSLNLRKQEFSYNAISDNLEGFIELEKHIHHEINFIFQICNKNPELLKQKEFLYIRDVIIHKSSLISQRMWKYNKIIQAYNKIITIKDYSIIWFIIPFQKKPIL